MFYLSKDCLSKIAYVPPISAPHAKIRIKDSAENYSRSYIFQVISIDLITNKHARLLLTDSAKKMYAFLDFSKIISLINVNPSTSNCFVRTSDEICMTLLEGTVFCLDEFYYESIDSLMKEFSSLKIEDLIICGSDCVDAEINNNFDHVVFLSECSIIGHISSSTVESNVIPRKRKRDDFNHKELYRLIMLNNSIRNNFWRAEVLLVHIGPVKEFTIKGTMKVGSCQRFLFRDSSANIELVVFNDLRLTKAIQQLGEVRMFESVNNIRIFA